MWCADQPYYQAVRCSTVDTMLECEYFTSGLCNACAWIDSAYTEQLILKIHTAKEHLHPIFDVPRPDDLWLEPATSPQWRYKSTATMTVSGTSDIPILGVLPDGDDVGVDITACPQFPEAMEFVFAVIQNTVAAAEIQPYHASSGAGELKTVQVTLSPAREVMIRFIVRTGAALTPLRTYLSLLLKPLTQQALPARVVSVYVEGAGEYALHGKYLTLQVDDVPLNVAPTSKFPTNPHVTRTLYRQARSWADRMGAGTVWNLHSGVGGLGLAMVRRDAPPFAPRAVWGIDADPDSVRAANITAHDMGYRDVVRFVPGDAARLDRYDVADLVTVCPPTTQGLGVLGPKLNDSGPQHLMIRSTRPEVLADDLVKLNHYTPISARLFDMYPNTPHAETAVLLERK